MSTGRERAVARELRETAKRNPRSFAPRSLGEVEQGIRDATFVKVNREITWGLTLNK